MRQMAEELTFPLEQPYIQMVVQLMNSVFGDAQRMWRTQVSVFTAYVCGPVPDRCARQVTPRIAEYFGVAFGKPDSDSAEEDGGPKAMHPSSAPADPPGKFTERRV